MKKEPPPLAAGVYAALITPRKAGSCEADAGRMLDYIDQVCAAGVAGLVLFGSTGEFVHFSVEERSRVASLAIRRSRVPVLVNVSFSDFAGVAALTESAIGFGAAGITVMPPYFYRYDAASVETFYAGVADSFSHQTPIYLYNLPQYTNPISPELAVKLLASGNFAGIKDSSGSWQMFEALRALRSERPFQLLMGSEQIYRRARSLGADGSVSGVAAALPELVLALEQAVVGADAARAEILDARLAEYLAWIEKFPGTCLIRQTAVLRGWVTGPPSLPLSPENEADMERFREWFPAWHAEVQAAIRDSTQSEHARTA